jgi:HAMP domain-containing protein
MSAGHPTWIIPELEQGYGIEPVISFCLPIRDDSNECVGVFGVGLSVNLFSQTVLETKLSPNSYSVLLDREGTYIIHPDRERLQGEKVFDQPDVRESPTALEAVEAMLKGDTGDMSFQMDGETWYMFFKPFVRANVPGRSMDALDWSIATIYPKADIFSEYNHLVFHVLGIVFVGLFIFYILCRVSIRRQLKPLTHLTESVIRIAEGHYDEPIPDTKRNDEVGVLLQHFQVMQQALASDISQQEQQKATLSERREELRRIHQQIQDDDNVKLDFLHNITNRMIAPSESILKSVNTILDNFKVITPQEVQKEMVNIKQQSEDIREILSHKFTPKVTDATSVSNNEGKEVSHE